LSRYDVILKAAPLQMDRPYPNGRWASCQSNRGDAVCHCVDGRFRDGRLALDGGRAVWRALLCLERRRQEIGLRIALGAGCDDVLGTVFRKAARVVSRHRKEEKNLLDNGREPSYI